MQQNKSEILTYLAGLTDWANEYTGNPRYLVTGQESLTTIRANMPMELLALRNGALATTLRPDLPPDTQATLHTWMQSHFNEHGFERVDIPTVENYNLNRAVIGALIVGSVFYETVGDSFDLASALVSGLRGDAVGVMADLAGIIAPRALGYMGDLIHGGRRLVGGVVDSANRGYDYLSDTIRKLDQGIDEFGQAVGQSNRLVTETGTNSRGNFWFSSADHGDDIGSATGSNTGNSGSSGRSNGNNADGLSHNDSRPNLNIAERELSRIFNASNARPVDGRCAQCASLIARSSESKCRTSAHICRQYGRNCARY